MKLLDKKHYLYFFKNLRKTYQFRKIVLLNSKIEG